VSRWRTLGSVRAWLCQYIWRAVCYPLGALPCTCLARRTAERSKIPRACDRRALRTPQTYRRCARRAGSPCEPCGRSRGRTRSITTRHVMLTTEVAQEQGVVAVTLDEVVPLALLARLAFFASGHQVTLSSIRAHTPTVTYPLSPLLVILNTFCTITLIALATSLFGIWNVAPLTRTPVTPPPHSHHIEGYNPHHQMHRRKAGRMLRC
jgi:hypothetical protein